jgi:class 3 adenylate cyclase
VLPRTQYARCGDLNLAYQVAGQGAVDLVSVPSFVSHLDLWWGHPAVKSWLDRLTSFARLISFDKAGTGLSDPVSGVPTIEERAAEIEAVMDAAGSERAALFGLSEGGPSSIFFAAARPERVSAMVLFGTYATGMALWNSSPEDVRIEMRRRGVPDEYVPSQGQLERNLAFQEHVRTDWGDGKALGLLVPDQGDPIQLALLERVSASPGMARATMESAMRLDVADLLPTVAVPTLVVHARDDLVPIQLGRYIADHIPGARLLEVPGRDHAPWFSDPDAIAAEIEELLTGARHAAAPHRALATVLFTDIVSSTEQAAQLGDARWRAVLEGHHQVVREQLGRFDGSEVKTVGDGFLATFEGPARAIRCAEAILDAVHDVGVQVRVGIHTGECEVMDDDVGGMAVHIAARVSALAGPGEILVSRTVRDLVVGSGIEFKDRGDHDLKGVPGEWGLLAVAPERPAGSTEAELDRMETPSPRASMRPADRVAAAVVRRAPGVIRVLARAEHRARRGKALS